MTSKGPVRIRAFDNPTRRAERQLRLTLRHLLIAERVRLAVLRDGYSAVESAIHRASQVASNLTRRTFKSPEEATAYLQKQVDLVRQRLERR